LLKSLARQRIHAHAFPRPLQQAQQRRTLRKQVLHATPAELRCPHAPPEAIRSFTRHRTALCVFQTTTLLLHNHAFILRLLLI
jgi:hypothetical protein